MTEIERPLSQFKNRWKCVSQYSSFYIPQLSKRQLKYITDQSRMRKKKRFDASIRQQDYLYEKKKTQPE